MKLALFLLVILALMLSSSPAPTSNSQQAEQYRAKLKKVNVKIRDVQKKLEVTKKKQKVVSQQLYHTQKKLNDTRQDLTVTRANLTSARGQLVRINSRLKTAEGRLFAKRKALTERLTDAYKNPPRTYMMALVTSEDPWTAMTRTKMISQVVESDKKLLEDIRQTREEIRRDREYQQRKVGQIRTLENSLSVKEYEEKRLAWDQHAQLKEIIRDRVSYERSLDELVAQSQRLSAYIRRMQATPDGQKRLAIPFKGGFIRPVNGRISSSFGMRYHPILKKRKLHTGVDIAAPTGTPIKAAASGTVVLAEWYGAYGLAVVIDHGGDVVTLYGHCSSISVSRGQTVIQGQTIGRVGSTGLSTGPHLHFEVQRNGRPVNPM